MTGYLRPRMVHFAARIDGDKAQAKCWAGPPAEGITIARRYWTRAANKVTCFRCLEILRKETA